MTLAGPRQRCCARIVCATGPERRRETSAIHIFPVAPLSIDHAARAPLERTQACLLPALSHLRARRGAASAHPRCQRRRGCGATSSVARLPAAAAAAAASGTATAAKRPPPARRRRDTPAAAAAAYNTSMHITYLRHLHSPCFRRGPGLALRFHAVGAYVKGCLRRTRSPCLKRPGHRPWRAPPSLSPAAGAGLPWGN
jgi:hypothetical protein